MTLQTAVETMVSTMQNPMGPESCALKFFCAVGRFRQATPKPVKNQAQSRKFLESYPDVMRATISFLTRKQSSADHASMIEHLDRCHCGDSDPEARGSQHSVTQAFTDPRISPTHKGFMMHLGIAFLIDCLMSILTNLTHGKFRQEKKDGGNSSMKQPWPHGIDDLLPNGLAHSVDGFDLWAANAHCGYLFLRLAGSIAHAYPAFAVEIMSRSPNFHLGLHCPAQQLSAAMDLYDQRPAGWNPTAIDSGFMLPLIYTVNFLGLLSSGGINPYAAMMGGTSAKQILLPVLLRGISILSLPGLETHFAGEFKEMWRMLAVINHRPQDGYDCLEDPLEECFNALRIARRGGCLNITCLAKAGMVQGRCCGNCDLIRFCDKKCQTEAWRDRSFPHKAVCAKIKSLRETLGPKVWGNVVTTNPRFTVEDFKKACRGKRIDLKLVKEVGILVTCVQSSQMYYRSLNSS
ncbi:hypothetical protein D9611_003019 [Ephemerocybe angulata]|uniref:MYND-type domain-containing protein n=1 Tax=Ephemerocybe angulata TaxID=980116 RepID=A0A8H5C8I1_9AGAR|nr:hypothetical protein D9611_003019 [Tulosesus angulatus]